MNPNSSIAMRTDAPGNPPSQAETALNRIEDAITRLEDRAQGLHGRLVPVLSTAPKATPEKGERLCSSIPLVQTMDALTDRIASVAAGLEDLLDRLAV